MASQITRCDIKSKNRDKNHELEINEM